MIYVVIFDKCFVKELSELVDEEISCIIFNVVGVF